MPAIQDLISQTNNRFDILALQETWFIPHPDLINIPGYTFIHTNRQVNRGGGVDFFIRDGLEFKTLPTLSTFVAKTFESLVVEIQVMGGRKLALASVYCSPSPPPHQSNNNHQESFINHLNHLLHSINSQYSESYILTDSNINLLNPSSFATDYTDTIHTNGFIQCIQKATRIQNLSKSLIDHIIIKSSHSTITSGVLICDVSDHLLTFTTVPLKQNKSKNKPIVKRHFTTNNINRFKTQLQQQNWNEVYASNDANQSYDNFWDIFKTTRSIMTTSVPGSVQWIPLKMVIKVKLTSRSIKKYQTKN